MAETKTTFIDNVTIEHDKDVSDCLKHFSETWNGPEVLQVFWVARQKGVSYFEHKGYHYILRHSQGDAFFLAPN